MKNRLEIVINFPQNQEELGADMITNGDLTEIQKVMSIKILEQVIKDFNHDLNNEVLDDQSN